MNKELKGLKQHTVKQIEKVKIEELINEDNRSLSYKEVNEVIESILQDIIRIESNLIMSSEHYTTLGKLNTKLEKFKKLQK